MLPNQEKTVDFLFSENCVSSQNSLGAVMGRIKLLPTHPKMDVLVLVLRTYECFGFHGKRGLLLKVKLSLLISQT